MNEVRANRRQALKPFTDVRRWLTADPPSLAAPSRFTSGVLPPMNERFRGIKKLTSPPRLQ